jgi:hypothetical protein
MDSLNPFWVPGFVDGEGCFSVSFSKRDKWIEDATRLVFLLVKLRNDRALY